MSSVPQNGPTASPRLNARLYALVQERWPAAGPQRGQAPEPARLVCRRVLGVAA